jgi:triosephosphate isomerase (TIM)
MRKKIAAGNWKMNLGREEGTALVSELVNMVHDEVDSRTAVVLCPPFPFLGYVKKLFQGRANVFLGAQNCSSRAAGAYTGDVSAAMLKSFEVDYVILGHSERREHFHETNAELAEKTNLVLAHGMTPIFCCGESLQMRQAGDYLGFVKQQLTESLFHLSAEQLRQVVIAYEPIWAIGTGLTASAEQAQEMHAALRAHLAGQYGAGLAQQISILYGGSVNAKNAATLFACPDVDGGLVGGASLKSRDFTDIAKGFGY